MERIVGEQPLPWEADADGSQTLLKRLGVLKVPIMDLLERNPANRLGIVDFIVCCRRVLEGTIGREPED